MSAGEGDTMSSTPDYDRRGDRARWQDEVSAVEARIADVYGDDRCPGLPIHVDRYPGGLFTVDEGRVRVRRLRAVLTVTVELPAVPVRRQPHG